MEMFQCPTCGGKGWVDTEADSDFAVVKSIALSTMSTSETLMDECVKRGDRIKELEADLCHAVAGEHSADREIERLRAKIFDIEGREDLVTTELEHRVCVAEDRLRVVKEMRDELLDDWEAKRGAIERLEARVGIKDLRIFGLMTERDTIRKTHDAKTEELVGIIDDLVSERERDEIDLELLDEMLKVVNPLIKSGEFACSSANSRLLGCRMYELCQTVNQFRRKHNIVG